MTPSTPAPRIESLLSARVFQAAQLLDDRIYFVSNLSGRLSLYAMDGGGSVPEPLLPPQIALQDPHHVVRLYQLFPKLGKILIMLDNDGDENYQPVLVPMSGGYPEPAFGDQLASFRCQLTDYDEEKNIIYLYAEPRDKPESIAYRGDLNTGQLTELYRSEHGGFPSGANDAHTLVIIVEGYTPGDNVLFLWDEQAGSARVLHGRRLADREPGEEVALTAFATANFTQSEKGLLFFTNVFDDRYSLGYLTLDEPETIARVEMTGLVHDGVGEMENLEHLHDDRYAVQYNIDGVSWLYEGVFDEGTLTMRLTHVIAGREPLDGGVLDSYDYDKSTDRFVLTFSTATSPTQIYTVEGESRDTIRRHTNERILGLPDEWLSPGEDASFASHDGLRVSARLYLPAPALGFEGPRPLVYYIHGGPQSQERPDFAWFSMPLIQFLTLSGFAVFVPNARGSTGYGMSYMKHVDRDWGGQDRLDHVHAMGLLRDDPRVDAGRAGVIGRSYGGYMTLTLATRHPELWSAAVDMFGPYDLLTFVDRIPETWKPYFHLAIGHPERDKAFLMERSPRTYIDQIACPLLVIQGKNDPRVVERESRDVVEHLRGSGKEVDYLMFEDEGHDVLKFENKVTCYNAITDFFRRHLMPSD